jgi:metal-responsive CopG/Arc/MetJ family transcriptional regulator
MALLKEVAKTAKLNKETVIRFRCTNNFKQLLDYWVQKTGSNGRSEFIRNLVLVASSEIKPNKQMDKILNKEIELRE